MTKKIIIIDDEVANLTPLKKILEKEGFSVTAFTEPLKALEHIRSEPPHVIISDLRMPGMDGLSLLKSTKIISPSTKFILVTAYGTVDNAVTAMKDEATDFISKPIKRDRLLKTVKKAIYEQEMLDEEIGFQQHNTETLIGSSEAFSRLMNMICRAAKSNATILIEGETGTGKTLVAKEIHSLSARRSETFFNLDCNAIPESLIESELFGHEQGSFTGAIKQKIGRFEKAHGGTILLDEIGEIPPHVQVKLLRVLQEGEFERVGGNETIKVDVRIIAATNKNLEEEVKANRFREDLYYRLNVINLKTPPLRDRVEDIEPLAKAFLKKYSERQGKSTGFAPLVVKYLKKYNWPGNIRELEHAIESAVAMSIESSISLDSLPIKITDQVENILTQNEKSFQKRLEKNKVVSFPIGTTLKDIQEKMINEALEFTENDINLSAKLLGINSRTIYRHLEK